MTYQETIDYLYSRLPVFQNIGARAYKPGLHTTLALCELLDNPQEKYPTIHVGGTNGKGSTSHMLAAILQQAGYRVGLYTSPHLKSFTERIKVNGKEIDENFIVEFTDVNLSNIDKLKPSFFEVTVAMAFSYFAEREVDVAVVEVGMGGRMDSTNVIHPVLSLITNVSFDHTQYLGDTLVEIAGEKAGIIKKDVPVVVSEYQEEIAAVFTEKAESMHAPICFASETVLVEEQDSAHGTLTVDVHDSKDPDLAYPGLKVGLSGSYQLDNIRGVLKAVAVLKSMGYALGKEVVYEAMEQVVEITGLRGRWQKLGENPTVYCDTAHNVAGLSRTIAQFNNLPGGKRRFVIGFVGDKDITNMLRLFPADAQYYFTEPSNSRALRAADLQIAAEQHGLYGRVYADVNLALQAALRESNQDDCIYVGGSTFVVADLKEL